MSVQLDQQKVSIGQQIMRGQWQGETATVMGLGRFGGGIAVVQWLATHGLDVIVSDREPADALKDSITKIQPLVDAGCVQLHLGEHQRSDFEHSNLIVANPAIPLPWKNLFLQIARDAEVAITTEIQLVTELISRDRTIAITGSAGKSTTSAMVHHALRNSGYRSHLAGNIGGSLLGTIDAVQPEDFIVLELSSAMLHWLADSEHPWSPRVAAITNIEPNHINWHGKFEHYRDSKLNILRHQRGSDVDSAVMFQTLANEIAVSGKLFQQQSRFVILQEDCDSTISLQIPGQHNQRNARLAIAAATEMLSRHDVDSTIAVDALADFPGLPHRLQYIGSARGIQFFNDSKSTTPAATQLAVDSFDDTSRIHLIVGGSDKGSDLQPIADLAPRVKTLLAIGETGRAIVNKVSANSVSYVETINAAIHHALIHAAPGDIILLSPGCASFDQFANYEKRGQCFEQIFETVNSNE